jgi:hypothetical protein
MLVFERTQYLQTIVPHRPSTICWLMSASSLIATIEMTGMILTLMMRWGNWRTRELHSWSTYAWMIVLELFLQLVLDELNRNKRKTYNRFRFRLINGRQGIRCISSRGWLLWYWRWECRLRSWARVCRLSLVLIWCSSCRGSNLTLDGTLVFSSLIQI